MELTYTNGRWEDLGVIRDMRFDADFGDEENTFEITQPARTGVRLEYGALIYVEGTEYGGRVTKPGARTASSELTYGGKTWHGILASRRVCPKDGQDYVDLEGEANSVIGQILAMVDTGGLFVASPKDSFAHISVRVRYGDAWTVIRNALDPSGLRPSISYESGHVVVEAVPYVVEETDDANVEIEDDQLPVNHLICLGKGNLKNRTRIDLYADREGRVSRKQTIFGIDYNEDVYDYPNADDAELLKSGTEKLEGLQDTGSSSVSLNFTSLEDRFGIGDRLYHMDDATGVSATIPIGQKTLVLNSKGRISVTYGPRNGSENASIA